MHDFHSECTVCLLPLGWQMKFRGVLLWSTKQTTASHVKIMFACRTDQEHFLPFCSLVWLQQGTKVFRLCGRDQYRSMILRPLCSLLYTPTNPAGKKVEKSIEFLGVWHNSYCDLLLKYLFQNKMYLSKTCSFVSTFPVLQHFAPFLELLAHFLSNTYSGHERTRHHDPGCFWTQRPCLPKDCSPWCFTTLELPSENKNMAIVFWRHWFHFSLSVTFLFFSICRYVWKGLKFFVNVSVSYPCFSSIPFVSKR